MQNGTLVDAARGVGRSEPGFGAPAKNDQSGRADSTFIDMVKSNMADNSPSTKRARAPLPTSSASSSSTPPARQPTQVSPDERSDLPTLERPPQSRSRSERTREIIRRAEKLIERGSVQRESLQQMNPAEVAEFFDWLQAGAGGLFSPVADEGMAEADVVVEGDDEAATEVDSLNGEALVSLLFSLSFTGELPTISLSDVGMNSASAGEVSVSSENFSLVAELMGTEIDAEGEIPPAQLTALAARLRELLASSSVSASAESQTGQVAESPEATKNIENAENVADLLSKAELSGVLDEAAKQVGGGLAKDLPEVVLRALAAKILTVDTSTVANNDALQLDPLTQESLVRRALQEASRDTPSEAVAVQASEGENKNKDKNKNKNLLHQTDAEIAPPVETEEVAPTTLTRGSTTTPPVTEAQPFAAAMLTAGDLAAAKMGGVATSSANFDANNQPPDLSIRPLAAPSGANGITSTAAAADVAAPQQSQMMHNIERIQDVMRLAIRRGIQSVSLRLDPPEFGRVTVRLAVRDGKVSAVLQTETKDARRFLAAGVQQLRQSLAESGVELEHFDVNQREGDAGGGSNAGLNSGGSQTNSRDERLNQYQTDARDDDTDDVSAQETIALVDSAQVDPGQPINFIV